MNFKTNALLFNNFVQDEKNLINQNKHEIGGWREKHIIFSTTKSDESISSSRRVKSQVRQWQILRLITKVQITRLDDLIMQQVIKFTKSRIYILISRNQNTFDTR